MKREHFKLVDSSDYGGKVHYDADSIKYAEAQRNYNFFKERLESFSDGKSIEKYERTKHD